MQTRRIKITCDTASMMPIGDLEAFQGKLKSITEAEFEKLKAAILKYGFSFPVFVWRKSILDGHQRVQAVKRLIAAQQTGRKCYAMEISPQYVDVAIKRWQDFTGKDAVLERTGETFEMIKNAVTP